MRQVTCKILVRAARKLLKERGVVGVVNVYATRLLQTTSVPGGGGWPQLTILTCTPDDEPQPGISATRQTTVSQDVI